MATFAVISGNVVSNVIVADNQADAELATHSTCVEYTEANPAGVGWTYDPATGQFTPPTSN
jgi:hypothetical protein